jgi:hypothetical protein
MALSMRFKELSERVRELRKNLLPSKFSRLGIYSDRQLDHAKGYRLLVHAEIESYLEDVCKGAVISAVTKWKNAGGPSHVLISLLSSYHSSWSVHDEVVNSQIIEIAKSRKNPKESVEKVVELACAQFVQRVGDNHGIKEVNVKTLLLPVGIDIASLDNVWLADIDSFGRLRGEIAHKSKRTTSLVNPEDELKKVKALLVGLKKIDLAISSIV